MACDKEDTKFLLEQAEVPIPKGDIVRSEAGLEDAIERIGYPVVVKPVSGNHGRGITTDIRNWEDATIALEAAKKVSRSVIVEKFVTGDDYRLLVINYQLVAAAKRTAAHVIGDGKSTVQQLIDEVNSDPRRGYGHEKVLTQIDINDLTLGLLEEKGLTLDSVIPDGEKLKLKDTASETQRG